MRLQPKYDGFFQRISEFISTFIKIILNLLLVVLCLALVIGVVKSGYDLFTGLNDPLERILQKMLLDTVFIVALLEISITILSYLREGHVHVRYIVDTILIIMLNEIVVMWIRHPSLQEMIGVAIIVLALAMVRIAVTRFSPKF